MEIKYDGNSKALAAAKAIVKTVKDIDAFIVKHQGESLYLKHTGNVPGFTGMKSNLYKIVEIKTSDSKVDGIVDPVPRICIVCIAGVKRSSKGDSEYIYSEASSGSWTEWKVVGDALHNVNYPWLSIVTEKDEAVTDESKQWCVLGVD